MPIGAETVQRDYADIPDDEIVARVRAGNTALFEVLMRRYNQRLFRVARSILRDDGEAQDVMQDAYVRAYAHLGQFEGRAKFSTWLTKIAVHEALARLRRRGRHLDLAAADGETEEGPSMFTSIPRNPEDDASIRQLSAVLERAIDTLDDKQRIVFMMRDIQELSTAETAACLGITEESVKVRLHRARAGLRQQIDTQMETATRDAHLFLGARCDAMVSRVLVELG